MDGKNDHVYLYSTYDFIYNYYKEKLDHIIEELLSNVHEDGRFWSNKEKEAVQLYALLKAVKELGLGYILCFNEYQEGNVPDIIIWNGDILYVIELKHWIGAYLDRYKITEGKVRTQILPRFEHYKPYRKLLIISGGNSWEPEAYRLIRENGIEINNVEPIQSLEDIRKMTTYFKFYLRRLFRIGHTTRKIKIKRSIIEGKDREMKQITLENAVYHSKGRPRDQEKTIKDTYHPR